MSKKRKKDLKRAERRKLELEHRRKKTRTILAVSVLLIVTICVIVYASMFMGGSNSIQNPESTKESNVQTEFHVVQTGGDAGLVDGLDEAVLEHVIVDEPAVADGAVEHLDFGSVCNPGRLHGLAPYVGIH